MNVLLVTEPGVDGVFRYVEALAHHLIEQGHEVHLAYSAQRGSDHLVALVAFVQQHGGRTVNLDTGNRPALRDFKAGWRLFQLVREVRPDLIHSHSSKAGGLARLLPLLGIFQPQFYHPHAYAGMRPDFGTMRLLYNGIESVLGRFAHTVNCSRDEQHFARRTLRLPEHRTLLVPNGVNITHFSPLEPAKKRELRERLGLPLDAVILGSMGRTSAQKDPQTLYRAFALAAARHPNLLLYHVGQGEFDGELNAFIREHGLKQRVIRHAYLSAPVEFHRAVDGFILTSRYEGFSLAVLEALACNQPLILSDGPGNNELATESLSHAQWVKVGDVEGFSQAISNWLTGLSRSENGLGCNHRAVAEKNFSSQRNLSRVLELYRKFAPHSTAGPPVPTTDPDRTDPKPAVAL